MNILISHVYSTHNNGDAAILSAQISELKRTFKNSDLRVLSIDKIKSNYEFDGIPVFNALMYWAISGKGSRLKKLFMAFTMMFYTLLWVIVFRVTKNELPLPKAWQNPIKLLIEADMQVCVGGGYLRAKNDHTSTVILVLLFHQIWLALLLNKPVYLYAQSFGPYPKKIQSKIATISLKKVNLILVREAKSNEVLVKMGIDQEHVVQVPDSAFMFNPSHSSSAMKLLGRKSPSDQIVGITVRSWLDPTQQTRYEESIAGFIDHLTNDEGFKVVVIAQVTSTHHNDDDRKVGERIRLLLKHNDNVIFLKKRLTHYDIKSIFSDLNYLIGTRFHSVIFSLTDSVPAIAIEYEHKTSGIMRDLELEKWVIDIEDVTSDKLTTLFKKLVAERNSYIQHLDKVLPEYISRAHESGQIIKQAYERLPGADDIVSQVQQK